MNFLAPLFLFGALAVALPIIFHLQRRTTRERTTFSSLMFLKAAPPRLTQRNRLEHLLLLLLRCAAICLLATGFARPFVKHVLPETPAKERPQHTIVLIDTSASMRRENLWAQAREKAEAIVQRAASVDQMALFTFDRQVTPLVSFEEWTAATPDARAALARSRLSEAKPSWGATYLDQAIIRASELLSEGDKGDDSFTRRVVVVSDFQNGSKSSALQGQQWPKGLEVTSERVITKTSNAGLQLLADANGTAGNVRVRVSNEADSKNEQFQVGWARSDGSYVGKANEIYVPAGQARIVTLTTPEKGSGADRIRLRGDEEEFDDTVFYVPPEAARINVVYVGSEAATDSRQSLYFVQRALQGTPQEAIDLNIKKPSDALSPAEAQAAAMFIVSGTLTEAGAAEIQNQLKLGKTVLLAPSDASGAATLGQLIGQTGIAAEEINPSNYAMLGEIDFRHPLFAAFADARYSDFTKIHFWKYRKLSGGNISEAKAVAKFDKGDPAILDFTVGKGHVLFFAAGWQPSDSQLALSTKFVPMLRSALELTTETGAAVRQYYVGDTVSLPPEIAAAGQVIIPDGSTLKLGAGETNFNRVTMPGIYQVKGGRSEQRFAANLAVTEGRTAPLPLDQLERLGVPSQVVATERAATAKRSPLLHSSEVENRQKLWRWFVVATLVVLLMETAIAGWVSARRSNPAGGAA